MNLKKHIELNFPKEEEVFSEETEEEVLEEVNI